MEAGDEKIEPGVETQVSLEAEVLDSPDSESSQKNATHLRLTKRDEELFLFLLDQKFACLEAIYFRFFDRRKAPTIEGF